MDKPTISINIIAKNEESTLARTVECVKEFADEIVIGVDRLSTDKTLEIAKDLADVFYQFDFNNNFARVRNFSMGKCTKEWMLILDAHEVIPPESIERMDKMWKVIPEGSTAAGVKLDMEGDSSGIQLRFLKNKVGWKWNSEVHNQLNKSEVDIKDINIGFGDIIIKHLPTPENRIQRSRQRTKMMTEIFTRKLKENPQDIRSLFYLGQMHHDKCKFKKALGFYLKYLKYTKDEHDGLERYYILWQLSRCRQALGQSDLAIITLDECIRMRWDIPLAYITKAEILHLRLRKLDDTLSERETKGEKIVLQPRGKFKRLIAEIEFLHENGLRVAKFGIPNSAIFYPNAFFTWLSWYKLADLYDDIGWYEQAIISADQALKYDNLTDMFRDKLIQAKQIFGQIIREDLIIEDEQIEKQGIVIKPGKRKLVVFDNIGSFTPPMMNHFDEDGYTVAGNTEFLPGFAWWADIVWYEWCNENVIAGSQGDPIEAQVICRVHGYEAYGSGADQVNYSYIDDLVFVSPHTRAIFLANHPEANECRTHVIPNGFDLDEWTYKKRKHGTVLGYAGYLKTGKNTMMLLDILSMLPQKYTLKIAGKWQDEKMKIHWDYIVKARLQGRVIFQEWQDDMDEWLEGIDYLISPSISESFSFVVAEAMAKGIKPVIYDRPGARDLWATGLVFQHPGQAVKMITGGKYNSEGYREWVKRYSFESQMKLTEDLFALGKRGNTQPKDPVREYRSESVDPENNNRRMAKVEAINV